MFIPRYKNPTFAIELNVKLLIYSLIRNTLDRIDIGALYALLRREAQIADTLV